VANIHMAVVSYPSAWFTAVPRKHAPAPPTTHAPASVEHRVLAQLCRPCRHMAVVGTHVWLGLGAHHRRHGHGASWADLHRVLRGEKDTDEAHTPTSFGFASSERVAVDEFVGGGG
jgi:hypothetical protein